MNDQVIGAGERIAATVRSWPDVEVGPHRFGGVECRRSRPAGSPLTRGRR